MARPRTRPGDRHLVAGGRGGLAGVESTDTSGVIPQQRRPGVRATAVNGPTAGTNGRATDTATGTGTATDQPTGDTAVPTAANGTG